MSIYMHLVLWLSLLVALIAWSMLRAAARDAREWEEIERWLDEGEG